jgi:hypothetical protein
MRYVSVDKPFPEMRYKYKFICVHCNVEVDSFIYKINYYPSENFAIARNFKKEIIASHNKKFHPRKKEIKYNIQRQDFKILVPKPVMIPAWCWRFCDIAQHNSEVSARKQKANKKRIEELEIAKKETQRKLGIELPTWEIPNIESSPELHRHGYNPNVFVPYIKTQSGRIRQAHIDELLRIIYTDYEPYLDDLKLQYSYS